MWISWILLIDTIVLIGITLYYRRESKDNYNAWKAVRRMQSIYVKQIKYLQATLVETRNAKTPSNIEHYTQLQLENARLKDELSKAKSDIYMLGSRPSNN